MLKCRKCPVCRVDLWSETHEESFKQLLNLSVTREPGAHTQAMQQLIGKGYHLGRGVAQNQTEAEKWICLAAESGYGESQVFLANMYLHLGLNATDGMMTGRMHDARAVQVPNADPISPTEASADYFAKSLKWSKRAVMQGKDERCYGSGIYSLGALYWNGNGVEQDMMFGLKCFQLAGMHGEAAGFEELAKRAVEGVQLTFPTLPRCACGL